jgi:hypothetical protein
VTGRDVPDGDMPNLPWPKHRDEPVTGDPSLADLLAWAEFTPSSAPEMRPVGEVLAALTAGPADDELAGEAAALAAYRNRGDAPRPATRAHRRTRRPLLSFPSALAAAVVISFSAFAAAAYTQVLPAPVQRLAHVIIGAPGAGGGGPAGGPSPAGSGTSGPDATGPGGAGGMPTGKAQPSPRPHASGQSTPQGSGQPSTGPTPSDSGTPTPTKSKGKPSTHPTNGNGNGGGNGNGNGSGNGNGNGNSDSTPTPQP